MPRLWRFETTIDTDVLAPGFYMKAPLAELASHCLEAVRPEFASSIQPDDIIIAGPNMGVGSSREQAAEVLKFLGVRAIIAPSFAGIFYRNAINLGLPAFTISMDSYNSPDLDDGCAVWLDFDTATLKLTDKNKIFQLDPMPDFLRELVEAGGLVPHLEQRFAGSDLEREV
jgi:3-isopropylmalate/(R)-2-methylmalate dehydratase small subunit